jgi:hypothetical protein
MFSPQINAFDVEIILMDAPHFESLVARLVPRSNLGPHFDCVGRSLDKLREITVCQSTLRSRRLGKRWRRRGTTAALVRLCFVEAKEEEQQ